MNTELIIFIIIIVFNAGLSYGTITSLWKTIAKLEDKVGQCVSKEVYNSEMATICSSISEIKIDIREMRKEVSLALGVKK